MSNNFYKRKMADFFITPGILNHMNILHGGELVKKLDSAMGILANEYANSRVLTGRMDNMIFYKKSYVGEHINFCVTLLKTTHKTMTFYAQINKISLDGSTKVLIGEAIFTYVAVDSDLLPISVKPYVVSDSDQVDFITEVMKRFNITE